MASLPTNRASYQHTDNITLGNRQPFACPSHRAILMQISGEAERAAGATTQAAFLLRMQTVRSLMRSLKA